ncbi:MAG TPA: DUF1572 family protein [Longimicrobiales bacterium]|nr:DUF1572 family protein [Longimicrobiales bacterium]
MTERAFIERSREYLTGEYLPKIRAAVLPLDEEAVWWRPNDASNSIGNLVLHLAGNVRQWIAHGVGREEDVRDRPAEFDAREGADAEQLLETLDAALAAADGVLAALPPEALHERRTIQGMDVSVLDAIYHVVEHFAGHTYQIIWIAKARTGRDLGFWKVDGGTATPAW